MSTISSTTSLLTSATSTTTTTTSSSSSSSSSSSTDVSDIDWDGLIEEAVNAKLAKAEAIEDEISENETIATAYSNMQTLLEAISDAAEALRAPSGSSSVDDDVFQSRTGYVTSSDSSIDPSDVLGVTVDNGSITGDYVITIEQLAKSHKVMGDAQEETTTELEYAGTFSLGIDDDSMTEIEITEDMTLDEIAEAINDVSETTGVQASVLQVSDDDYRLVISTVDTGEEIQYEYTDGDDVLQELGVTDSSGDFENVVQESQQAIITVDGVTITRSTNEIEDVIDGATLYLYDTTDDASIDLEISEDVSSIYDAIVALVDAYNAYREWAIDQQTVPEDDEDLDETNALFGDVLLRNVNSSIADALNFLEDENSMALLGLSFDENNYLELDEDTLEEVLLTDLDAVENLLTFDMTSSNTKLQLLNRGTEDLEDFTIDIEVDEDGDITSASVDGDDSLFTISGTRIVGAEGTIYEGYSFVYVGTSSVSVDLSFSTGIAELLYNVADAAANDTDGTITTALDDLDSLNEDLEAEAEDIIDRAETYRDNLTTLYASYQAAIEEAEAMQDYLTNLIDTWNAD